MLVERLPAIERRHYRALTPPAASLSAGGGAELTWGITVPLMLQ